MSHTYKHKLLTYKISGRKHGKKSLWPCFSKKRLDMTVKEKKEKWNIMKTKSFFLSEKYNTVK